MNAKLKLRFGVIGTGEFAQACHVPGLRSHPQAEVVALCGSDYQRVRSLAARLNIPDVHTDYEELCRRDDLDGVTIVTPNAFHAEQALVAFRNNKHVLCEKPLALNVAQAEKMFATANASGKVHQVAFTFRYGYAVRDLRRRIQAGDIGQPYYLRIQYDGWTGLSPDWKIGWRENRAMAGGGMLYDLGAHLFDIARFTLGELTSVTGFFHNIPRQRIHGFTNQLTDVETDDIAASWFCFENGARGQWFISRATPTFANNGYLEVVGVGGALRASLSRGKLDVLHASSPQRPEWKEIPLPKQAGDGSSHCLGLMMRSFVDGCIRGEPDTEFDASFADGLAVQRAIAAVMDGNDSLGWIPLRNSSN